MTAQPLPHRQWIAKWLTYAIASDPVHGSCDQYFVPLIILTSDPTQTSHGAFVEWLNDVACP